MLPEIDCRKGYTTVHGKRNACPYHGGRWNHAARNPQITNARAVVASCAYLAGYEEQICARVRVRPITGTCNSSVVTFYV
jgi:hypothetical protein